MLIYLQQLSTVYAALCHNPTQCGRAMLIYLQQLSTVYAQTFKGRKFHKFADDRAFMKFWSYIRKH